MVYVKRNIPNGHKLTAEDLAHLETGIDGAHAAVETIDVGVTTVNGITPDEAGNVVIEAGGGTTDLTGYATETYVNDAITAAGTGGATITEDPPGSGIYTVTGATITETSPGSGIYEIGA